MEDKILNEMSQAQKHKHQALPFTCSKKQMSVSSKKKVAQCKPEGGAHGRRWRGASVVQEGAWVRGKSNVLWYRRVTAWLTFSSLKNVFINLKDRTAERVEETEKSSISWIIPNDHSGFRPG